MARRTKTNLCQQAIYRRVVERANGHCEECGMVPDWRGLQMSHTIPKGLGGTRRVYQEDELKLLCGKCHSKRHFINEV